MRPDLSNDVTIIKNRVTGGLIKKATRFSKRNGCQAKADQSLFLNPNYELTKKNAPGFTIHKPTPRVKEEKTGTNEKPKIKPKITPKKPQSIPHEVTPIQQPQESTTAKPKPIEISTPAKSEKIEEPRTPEPNSFFDSFLKARSEWKKASERWAIDHEVELSEVSTMACSTISKSTYRRKSTSPKPRPASPSINDRKYRLVERLHSGFSFSKSVRPFSKSLASEDFGFLYPSLAVVKTNHPGPRIANKLPLTKQLEQKRRENEDLELKKAVRDLQKSIDPTEFLRAKQNIPIITKSLSEKENGRTEREAMILQLHKAGETVLTEKQGPGYYVPSFTTIDPHTPQVNLNKFVGHVTNAEILEEIEKTRLPGPTTYIPKEDVRHPTIPAFSIPKPGKPKIEAVDYRPALEVKDTIIRKHAPEIYIAPESEEAKVAKLRKETEIVKVGPGKYEPAFDLVEKRMDIGNVALVQPMERPKIAEEPLSYLMPNYDYDKPGKLVFQYKPPADVHPPHIPDSELHPEQWQFYDAEKKQHEPNYTFSSNLEYHKFQLAEEQRAIKEALKVLQHNAPAVGQYEPKLPQGHEGVDFSKGVSRDPYYTGEAYVKDIVENNEALIINPDKPRAHLPGIYMDRIKGREDNASALETVFERNDEVLLHPNTAAIKPQPYVLVNMGKQVGRDDNNLPVKDETKSELLLNSDAANNVMWKAPAYDFGKVADRDKEKLDQNQTVLDLHPKIDNIAK